MAATPRRPRTLLAAAIVTCGVVLASCSEAPNAPARPEAARDVAAERLAAFIAVAMGTSRDVRLEVRDAMRASPITAHKLLLQSYMRSDAGRAFANQLALINQIPVSEIDAAVASLPPFEFVMQYRGQRLTWDGESGDLEVGAILERGDRSAIAFSPRGSSRTVVTVQDGTQHFLFLLRPEREWSRRVGLTTYHAGSVIQEAGENELSGRVETVGRDGSIATQELADLPTYAARAAGVVGRTDRPRDAVVAFGSAPADTTWLISFIAGSDFNDYDGTVDPYYNACYQLHATADSICTENRIVHFYNLPVVDDSWTYYPVTPLLFHVVHDSSDDRLIVTIRERDQIGGGNTIVGRFIATWLDKLYADPFNGTRFWQSPGNCYHCWEEGIYSLRRSPIAPPPPPPPPPLSVTITGPASVRANNDCHWTASPAGGTTPYSYAWKVNGTAAGTGSIYEATTSVPISLSVTVTDATNSTKTAALNISISSTAPLCAQ